MRSYVRTTAGITADPDGIATTFQPAAGTAVTLNGATGATLDPPRRVTITSAANVSGTVFAIVGKDRAGATITENVTGPNATTVTSTKVFASITSITPTVTVAQDVTIGFGAENISPWLFLGHLDTGAAYAVEVTGTVAYDIEQTFRNILREGINGDYEVGASDLQTNKTAAINGVIDYGVGALRVVQNSGTGSITLRVIPSRGR